MYPSGAHKMVVLKDGSPGVNDKNKYKYASRAVLWTSLKNMLINFNYSTDNVKYPRAGDASITSWYCLHHETQFFLASRIF